MVDKRPPIGSSCRLACRRVPTPPVYYVNWLNMEQAVITGMRRVAGYEPGGREFEFLRTCRRFLEKFGSSPIVFGTDTGSC